MTKIACKITNNAFEKSMFSIPYLQYETQQEDHSTFFHIAIKTCRKYCSTCTSMVFILVCIISVLLLSFKPSSEIINVVVFDAKQPPIFITNSKFLSVALDSSVIAEGFRGFNMSDPKLQKLLTALAPGYFRVGGTMADRLHFVANNEPRFKIREVVNTDGGVCAYETNAKKCDVFLRPNFTMSGEEWLALNRLITNSGFTLLFDLNCLIRFKDGSWNPANAESLIEFSNKYNLNVIWELGNEPNAFRHVFDYEVNATQLGKDFLLLKNILRKYPRYRDALLVGPDTTRPKPEHQESVEYLKEFLEIAGNVVDAVTWHQYYFNGRTANGFDFIDPEVFDLLQKQIDVIKTSVSNSTSNDKPIWLGETSSAYGGGAPQYSNKYVSIFIWLDKLGLSAKNGLDLVIRQSFFKGYYALLYDDYKPTPDFWISVLYKKLVGPQVVPCYKAISNNVRIYCHCAKKANLTNEPSVVIFAMNMKPRSTKIRLQNIVIEQNHIFAYIIQPDNSLLSSVILLNDHYLSLRPNGNLPEFEPKILLMKSYLFLPAYSVGFWVIPAPAFQYCTV